MNKNQIRPDTGIAQLIVFANDKKQDKVIRIAAIHSLGHAGSTLAVSHLLEISKDESIDCEYRVAAINALGKALGGYRAYFNVMERE